MHWLDDCSCHVRNVTCFSRMRRAAVAQRAECSALAFSLQLLIALHMLRFAGDSELREMHRCCSVA